MRLATPDFFSRSYDAVIRVYDAAGNVIETHEHAGEFKESKMPDLDLGIVIRHFVRFSEGEIDLSEASPEMLV